MPVTRVGRMAEGARMRFGLLGPLLVDDGGVRPVAGVRQRRLLAALLVRANRVVSLDALAEIVWDGVPPAAPAALRTQVMRLRRALGSAADRVVTRDPGYVMTLDAEELDITLFEALYEDTGVAVRAEQWPDVLDCTARALGLWRGQPLSDVDSPTLRDECVGRLEELRAQAVEWRTDAELHLGRHGRLVPALREQARRQPLREHTHAQLMIALYRCGRRPEALEVYHAVRRTLADELGIEPGLELRRLQKRILDADGDLLLPDPDTSTAAQKSVPRQLPAAAQYFTGRGRELDDLLTWCNEPSATGGPVVISAIDGMAGIGKTALAVHTAHKLAGAYPDGQLFIDLHGYTKGSTPREAGDALEVLLRGLGVNARQVPEDLEERAAFYRQHLADTRTLIVLDNAAHEAQVRPLLPGHPGCLVLVTSRKRLKGLDDARSLSLDLLPPADAVALLRAVAGPERFPADDSSLDEVAHLCGQLPLALRIAGALLRHRPAWNLEHLAALLRDQRQRLKTLSDGERDLATVLNLSYTGLDEPHRLLFRCLGLLPGPDADAAAAAALLECDADAVTGLLEDLVDHNLLIEYVAGRYRLHDLLRAHARTLAVAVDAEPERAAAEDRLLHYYAHTAQTASLAIARTPRPGPDGLAPAHVPAPQAPEAARAWLRTEYPNLEAAFAHAHTGPHALDQHTIALAAGLAEILVSDGPWSRALEIHQAAAEAAARRQQPAAHATALTDLGWVRRLTGDSAGAAEALGQALEIFRAIGNHNGEANALTYLGQVREMTGDLPGAAEALGRALEIFRTIGQGHGEANALIGLGQVRHLTGDYSGAAEALGRALEIFRTIGQGHGEANALIGLGRVRHLTGDYSGAAEALGRALEISRAIGNHNGEANALTYLGRVRRLTGDYSGAAEALGRALEIFRTIGQRLGEANALTGLGQVRHLTGDYSGAAEALGRALEIFRTIGNRTNEAWALNHYAATLAALGERSRALALYRQSLAMNRELDKPDDEAISLEGIGEQHLATGSSDRGVDLLREALEIYQRLGMTPDAERVRTRLAHLETS